MTGPKPMRILLLSLLAGLTCSISLAQELYIDNARIITGSGETIDNGVVHVSGDRIRSIGAAIEIPDGANVLNAAGMSVMPGLINAHWHLYAGSGAASDEELRAYKQTAVVPTLANILERGVTTIMSPGDHYPDILELRDALAAGTLRGPRLIAVGPVFTSPVDWPTQLCGSEECNLRLNAVVATEADARKRVRELAAAGVDALKLVYDDIIAPDVRIADDVVAAIADEAHSEGLRVLAHVSSTDVPARRLLELGVDGFVHAQMDLTGAVEELRERQIPVITTSTVVLDVDQRPHVVEAGFVPSDGGYMLSVLDNVELLVREGVTVAFGTDSVAGPAAAAGGFLSTTNSGAGLFLAEARSLTRVLSNAQVIATMTRDAAKVVGLGDEIGTLEAGKIADITIIDGDPLADIADLERVRVVIQRGRIVVDRR